MRQLGINMFTAKPECRYATICAETPMYFMSIVYLFFRLIKTITSPSTTP